MDHVTLLQTALEALLEGDAVEAAYAFRSLAEELEEGSSLEPEDIIAALVSAAEGY